MQRFWKAFFWGAPSHKRIAWVGALSGLGVIAFAVFIAAIGHGALLFLLAVLLMGLANFGWGAELLPTRSTAVVGWLRIGRWGSAVLASVLGLVSLLLGITFAPIYGLVILGTGLLQAFEFAPGGPANKP